MPKSQGLELQRSRRRNEVEILADDERTRINRDVRGSVAVEIAFSSLPIAYRSGNDPFAAVFG